MGMHRMHWNAATLLESARAGAASLRANPMRTVLATTGVIIGVAALVAAFAITDGVDVWSRALIARESSVQDVAITPRTRTVVRGRSVPVHGYPAFSSDDAARAGAEVPGVLRHVLMLNGTAPAEYLDRRAMAAVTLSTASLADFTGMEVAAGRFFTTSEDSHGAPVVMLGHRLAEELAGAHDGLWLVGRSVRLGGERREVIGVLSPRRPATSPTWWRSHQFGEVPHCLVRRRGRASQHCGSRRGASKRSIRSRRTP